MKRLNVLAIMLIVTGIAWGQSYKRLEQQAQKGEATARELYMLGDHYHGKKDYEKAAYWMRLAAEKGETSAIINMGDYYFYGEGVPYDVQTAVSWWKKIAKSSEPARLRLGMQYCKESGYPLDLNKAISFWEHEANKDNFIAQYSLGICYYEGVPLQLMPDYEKAVFWLLKSSERDYEPAWKALARCFYEGKGMKHNFMEAIHLWERVHDAESAYNLGKCYELGTGVMRDSSAANNWYVTAVREGSVRAMYLLGYRHRRGENISKDVKQAVGYYEQLLAVPDSLFSKTDLPLKTFAKLELATIYGYGEGGVRLDVQKASHLLEGLAKDFMFADEVSVLLGDIHYEDGARGTQGSYEKAVSFLEKAKSSDESNVHAAAAFLFAKCYRFGRGVPQDVAKADKLLKEAVSYGWGKFSSVSELVPTFKIEHTWPMPAGF